MITLTIHYDQQLHAAIKYILHQQSLKSRVIKGEERGVAVGGCRGSVAERWQLKPEALGAIPGSATFLSFPLPFQRSLIRRSLLAFGPSPVHRTPHAVIRLTIHNVTCKQVNGLRTNMQLTNAHTYFKPTGTRYSCSHNFNSRLGLSTLQ